MSKYFLSFLTFLFFYATSSAQLSKHIANYRLDARLDVAQKAIHGKEILSWLNDSKDKISELYFHLYANAFRNGKSTLAREMDTTDRRRSFDPSDPEQLGWIDVKSLRIVNGEDLTPFMEFVHPDDDNANDQTVMKVVLPRPLKPQESIQLSIEFSTKLPRGISRSNYARGREFYFAAQWFPKIGVYQQGEGWNCHQFHANTEFFADFGEYTVNITVPEKFIVGATGVREKEVRNSDGTMTYMYHQADVHDFAWTASPEFLEFRETFKHEFLPPTEIILLLQPEHLHYKDRYFIAVRTAMKHFGEWYGEYPYKTITVVDPPHTSSVGGMEYPTLITCSVNWLQAPGVLNPEGVTVHEFGHQYWYGMVANNEFEEAWLDEGFNSYSTGKILSKVYGPNYASFRIAGGLPFSGFPILGLKNFPVIAVVDKVALRFPYQQKDQYLSNAKNDPIGKISYKTLNRDTYRVNSYIKSEMILTMLENYLGEGTMAKIMRTYHQRWRFKHPTTRDFIVVVNEVAGKDMNWFFDQIVFDALVLDYEVTSISSQQLGNGEYDCEVLCKRNGEVKFPVELLVTLASGEQIKDSWNGKDRWMKFKYKTGFPIVLAQIDPENKLVIDIDFSNNSKKAKSDNRAALRWSSKWLFWMQNLLQWFAALA